MNKQDREALLQSVAAQVEAASAEAARYRAWWVARDVEVRTLKGEFESPIEVVFYAWWQAISNQFTLGDLMLFPQHEVLVNGSRYRVDFVVTSSTHADFPEDAPKVAIELDGHDFHEKTKQQVTYRNRRDRELQADGWKVLHVSGSELMRDPVACVGDVMKLISREHIEFVMRHLSTGKGNP